MKVEYTKNVLHRAEMLTRLELASTALAVRGESDLRGFILGALTALSLCIPAASAAQILTLA